MIAAHIAASLCLLLASLLTIAVLIGWGSLIRRFIGRPFQKQLQFADAWIGLLAVIAFTESYHLWLAIDWRLSLLVVLIGVASLKQALSYVTATYNWRETLGKLNPVATLVACFLLFTWTALALTTPSIYDGGLYHFQAIQVAVGKRCGKLSSAQQFINKRLLDAAQKYHLIVRLKGGDPMLFVCADEEITALKQAGVEMEVVPSITAALAGAASIQQSLTLRGVSRSVAFITLAQGNENVAPGQPIANPNADTLEYYMGRKDAVRIAQQLIDKSPNQNCNTPVQILEAVSTPRERFWTSALEELAAGKADEWFDSNSPALIMVGEALGNHNTNQSENSVENLERPSGEIDNSPQDSEVLSNGRRRT